MEDMVKPSEPGAYMILNIVTNARYVGSAAQKIYARFGQHRYRLRSNKHSNKHLQSSWNKHGEGAFRFIALENCAPEDVLGVENKWFNLFKKNSLPLYNKRENVKSQLGMKHSQETRQKLSESLKGRKHIVSEEGMANIVSALRGNKYAKDAAAEFEIISPTGERIKGKNLSEFCSTLGFKRTGINCMYEVVRGSRPSYKGYTNPESRAAYLMEHPFKRPPKTDKVCEQCGKHYSIKPSHAHKSHFCSKACRFAHDKAAYSGANNPNYRHGGRVNGVKRIKRHLPSMH